MLKWLLVLGGLMLTLRVNAQNFELVDHQENFQAFVNQVIRIPLKIKNNSDKAQFYIVRKTRGDLGESQKGYFCIDNNCLEASIVEFSKRVEPGETLNLSYTVESGLQSAQNSFKFEVFPKGNPSDAIEQAVNLVVDERVQRSLYQSKDITIHDVYPNPVQDQAIIDYKINSDLIKVKIVLQNVLGRPMGEYELSEADTRIKIQTDDLPPGIYFYTLYIDHNGVFTRKIMVRR